MSDLVERLRNLTPLDDPAIGDEAADRIELLEGVYEAARWFSIHMPAHHIPGLIERRNYMALCEALDALAAAEDKP